MVLWNMCRKLYTIGCGQHSLVGTYVWHNTMETVISPKHDNKTRGLRKRHNLLKWEWKGFIVQLLWFGTEYTLSLQKIDPSLLHHMKCLILLVLDLLLLIVTERRYNREAVSIGTRIYITSGWNDSNTTSSIKVFEMSTYSFYILAMLYLSLSGKPWYLEFKYIETSSKLTVQLWESKLWNLKVIFSRRQRRLFYRNKIKYLIQLFINRNTWDIIQNHVIVFWMFPLQI